MKIHFLKTFALIFSVATLGTACSVAKLEARLEANPQCKDVVNPKTGALMPCPGSDKAFYRELGLMPPKPAPTVTSPTSTPTESSSTSSSAVAAAPAKAQPAQTDCKPQVHKKSGVIMPCPAPD